MDGALLRLDVELEEVRLRLGALFAPRGVTRPFRPIARRIREAAREAGDVSLEAAGFAILDDWEVRAAGEARARAGAAEVVEALAARGDRLALVTSSGRAAVRPALAAAGIAADRFAAIAAREDGGAKPAALAVAIAAVGGTPAWYVVDHPSDAEAGRAAGLRVAALAGDLAGAEPLRRAGAEKVLSDLRDVSELL